MLKGKQTGFAYTSDLTPERMKKAALTAAAIASTAGTVRLPEIREVRSKRKLYVTDRPCAEAPLPDKIVLVREAYQAAKGHDPRIGKVQVTLLDELQYVVIANSEGLLVADTRPQVRFMVQATAEANGKRGTGRDNAGGRIGMAFFAQPGRTPREIGVRASQEALLLLEAVDPAPGEQPVVLGRELRRHGPRAVSIRSGDSTGERRSCGTRWGRWWRRLVISTMTPRSRIARHPDVTTRRLI